MKIFQLEQGKYSNQKEENIPKRKIFQLEKGNHSNQKKKNLPIRKKKEKKNFKYKKEIEN